MESGRSESLRTEKTRSFRRIEVVIRSGDSRVIREYETFPSDIMCISEDNSDKIESFEAFSKVPH